MISQENTSEEIQAEFLCDAKRWKLMLGYKENEIEFINNLLNSDAFKVSRPNLFERLQGFKDEVKIQTKEIVGLKREVIAYKNELKRILECEDVSCDTFYLENHKLLKNRFEEFYTSFNEYKTQVYNYTGGVL
jgi:hypothetical protein